MHAWSFARGHALILGRTDWSACRELLRNCDILFAMKKPPALKEVTITPLCEQNCTQDASAHGHVVWLPEADRRKPPEPPPGCRRAGGAMSWTCTPPTEPGYYWIREFGDAGSAHVIEIRSGGVIHVGDDLVTSATAMAAVGMEFWSEAIQPPE